MESSTVIRLTDRRARESRIGRAMDARRRLQDVEPERSRGRGRVWLNGVEIGGSDRRFSHLSVFHD